MDSETKALIAEVARQSAEVAVNNALTRLGIDNTAPFETQRDMASLHEIRLLLDDPELQKDLIHLRRWRKTMGTVQSKGLMVGVAIIVSGVLATLWIGFKDVLKIGS